MTQVAVGTGGKKEHLEVRIYHHRSFEKIIFECLLCARLSCRDLDG